MGKLRGFNRATLVNAFGIALAQLSGTMQAHVDGGASAQVFVYPPSLKVGEISSAAGVTRERRAYIIRNARLDPDWADTQRQFLSIAGRAVSSLIQRGVKASFLPPMTRTGPCQAKLPFIVSLPVTARIPYPFVPPLIVTSPSR
ncbi:MAG: MmgE/PrpD family protein [Akkermansiaceae bacterium]|nr:MmgE/PrpD family protein [Akkermansiaceae bacterium]